MVRPRSVCNGEVEKFLMGKVWRVKVWTVTPGNMDPWPKMGRQAVPGAQPSS